MPELPDVVVYCERLQALAGGTPLLRLRLASPWVLRSVDPPVARSRAGRSPGCAAWASGSSWNWRAASSW